MFSRYWRTYPPFLQLVLFGLMVFTLMSFGTLIDLLVIPKVTGISLKEINSLGPDSPPALSKAVLWFQAFWHFFTFAAPCLLYAYVSTPRPAEYLALKAPRNAWQPVAVIGLMLGYLLFSLPLESFFVQHIHLPKAMRDANDALEKTNAGLLKFRGPADLMRVLFVLAVLVPFGEELMFRGLLMRFAARRAKSIHFPVILSAILFAAMHQNPYGLVFILIAGFLLGGIFWRTGSLWCCMLGHAVYNGTQIVLSYADSRMASETHTPMPSYLSIVGAVLMAACGWWLYKSSTPLPLSWAQDFNEEELRSAKEKWDIDAGNDANDR